MDETGSKNVPFTELDDKREITALFSGATDGSFLPPQLIYGGKTDRSHPQGIQCPHEWNISHNDNHWSNETSMLEYLEKLLNLTRKKRYMNLGYRMIRK